MSDYISREAILIAAGRTPPKDRYWRNYSDIIISMPAEKIVRCRDCIYWKPPHVREKNGHERLYNPGTDMDDILGLQMVSVDVGINVGGQCYVDYNCGYAEDKVVFRDENEYCSRGRQGENYPLNVVEGDVNGM